MRIGELNPYRYNHISKQNNSTPNVEKANSLPSYTKLSYGE